MKSLISLVLIGIVFYPFSSSMAQTSPLTETDLLGDWRCDALLHGSVKADPPSPIVQGWNLDADGLFLVLADARLNFTASGGAYQVTSSAPNPVLFWSEEAIQSPYRVKDGFLSMTFNASGTNFLYEIGPVDADHVRLKPLMNGFYPSLSCERFVPLGLATTTDTTTATSTKPVTAANAATPAAKKAK